MQIGAITLFLSACSADQSIKNQAEQKVRNQASVDLKWPVARQREVSRKQEVGQVAQQNSQKSLEKIS